jgi:hypothetical protein
MHKFFACIFSLSLGLCIHGNCTPVSAAEPAASSFAEKMQAYEGRTLNGKEVKEVLVGNTLYQETNTKRGTDMKVWWWYQSDQKMLNTDDQLLLPPTAVDWWVNKRGRYCHRTRTGGKFCRHHTEVFRQGNEVRIVMTTKTGRKARIFTLLKGKHRE